MKEKKQYSYWNIAVTHFLTSGFTTFVVNIILVMTLMILFGKENIILISIIKQIIFLLAIWLSVMYSAKYIKGRYIIKESDKIIKSATMYFIIIGIGFWLFYIVRVAKGDIYTNSILDVNFFIDNIFFFLEFLVFYLSSKKYIHNTSQNNTQMKN